MSDAKKTESNEQSEDELDQIIRDMAEEEDSTPAAAPISLAKAPKTPNAGKKEADQSLTMELTGVINLKLCFASGDRSIEVLCTEEALLCRMADGTEFRIPTGMHKKRSAA